MQNIEKLCGFHRFGSINKIYHIKIFSLYHKIKCATIPEKIKKSQGIEFYALTLSIQILISAIFSENIRVIHCQIPYNDELLDG